MSTTLWGNNVNKIIELLGKMSSNAVLVAPSADGVYALEVTVKDGSATYTWKKQGSSNVVGEAVVG